MLSILPIITDYKSIERVNIDSKKCLLWIVADKNFKENFKTFYDRFRKLNLDGLMVSGDAVSYTHLDVYKRQIKHTCANFGRILEQKQEFQHAPRKISKFN